MFSSDRNDLRKTFFEAWRKHKENLVLEPLEAQLVEIFLLHPEYHEILSNPETFQEEDFPEGNPFLHMSLHLAIREQINTDRPLGIKKTYNHLCNQINEPHLVEHRMLDCLAEILWQAQESGKMPSEDEYLELLKRI